MEQLKICILNGPNLNYLGKREPSIYGSQNFNEYLECLRATYSDFDIEYFQSNIEGELINKLYELNEDSTYIGVVFNAGAYTHTSIALHDCIKGIQIPVIEVHISNVAAREEYRKISYISDVCIGTIAGFGYNSYKLAVEYFANMVNHPVKEIVKENLKLETPSSKSELQRAILIAACEKTGKCTTLLNVNQPLCADVISTINFVKSIGVKVEILDDGRINVYGIDLVNSIKELNGNVGESGTLLRMLIGMLSVSKAKANLSREGSLAKRKMNYSVELANKFGNVCSIKENNDISLSGTSLEEDHIEYEYELDGKESSQYISGLLVGLAYSNLFTNTVTLKIKNAVSVGYINITLDLLKNVCYETDFKGKDLIIELYKTKYNLSDSSTYYTTIQPDFSSVTALATAIFALKVKKPVEIVQNNQYGYDADFRACRQPDLIFLDWMLIDRLLEEDYNPSKTSLALSYYDASFMGNSRSFDITQFPDLFPYLAVVGILSKYQMVIIRGISRLRNKESDRAEAILNEFHKLGSDCELKNSDDSFTIYPYGDTIEIPEDYVIKTYNDHRIAMAMAIIVLSATNDFNRIKFDNEECLNKSYPNFMKDLRKIFDYKNEQ